jgi:ketopantoate reductase
LKDAVPDLDKLLRQVVQEVCLVQRTFVAETSSKDRIDLIAPLGSSLVTQFVHQVIADDFDNRTWLQQDVLHKRPTEIDCLNGYITRAGAKYAIECPTNRRLKEQVLDLETKHHG